jgi:Protein of unknown function (DUF1698)
VFAWWKLSVLLSGIRAARRAIKRVIAPRLPESGFPTGTLVGGPIETLDDDSLRMLNELLPWQCFTVDSKGRRLGGSAWSGKRDIPQPLPDPRVVRLHELVDLVDKKVLEVGCFEGVHTVALCQRAAQVYAIDARIENVVKTTVRSALYGCRPIVDVVDVESASMMEQVPRVDVVHHVGVLYHLADPVRHLTWLAEKTDVALMLDTHIAQPEETDVDYETRFGRIRARLYREGGRRDVFSGLYDHAKWLTEDDLIEVLRRLGLDDVRVRETRKERNGTRLWLLVSRSASRGRRGD